MNNCIVCAQANFNNGLSFQKLDNLRDSKINKIEISCGAAPGKGHVSIHNPDKHIINFSKQVADKGYAVDVLHIDDEIFSSDSAERIIADGKNSLLLLDKVISFAKLLNAPVIRWRSALLEKTLLTSQLRKSLIAFFMELGRHSREKGIDFGLEPPDGCLLEINETMEFFSEIGNQSIGFCFNPAKFLFSGVGSERKMVRKYDDHLNRDGIRRWYTEDDLKKINGMNDIDRTPLRKIIKCFYLVNYKKNGNLYTPCNIWEGIIDNLLLMGQLCTHNGRLPANNHIIIDDPGLARCYKTGHLEFGAKCFLDKVIEKVNSKYDLNYDLSSMTDLCAKIEPCTAISWQMETLKIKMTVGESSISPGGMVKIQFRKRARGGNPQIADPAGNGYVTAVASRKETCIERFVSPSPQPTILLQINNAELVKGNEIEVIIGDKKYGGKGIQMEPFPLTQQITVAVDNNGTGRFLLIEKLPVLKTVGGKAEKICVLCPSTVKTGEPFNVGTIAEDSRGYPAHEYQGIIKLEDQDGLDIVDQSGSPTNRQFDNQNFKSVINREGIYYLSVKDDDSGLNGISNPIICSENVDNNIFWGDIHAHSTISDGANSIDFLYEYARYSAKLDFAAAADHGSLFNNSAWEETKKTINKYHENGKFAALLGSEYNPKDGHKNICFSNLDVPSLEIEKAGQIENVWEHLKQHKGLLIHHQMATVPKSLVDWDHCNPKVERLMEIVSCHGNNENKRTTSKLYSVNEGHYVQDALARGYRFGFCASSDTHDSHCGYTPYGKYKYSPLVAVFAKTLDRDSIFDALWNRRCYATTGARIILNFKLNGHLMGEEIKINEKIYIRNIEIKVIGTEKIEQIDIIRNNNDIYSHKGKSDMEEIKWRDKDNIDTISFFDKNRNAPFVFYYIRVTQSDGEMAWSSPIWISPAV